MKHRNRAKKVNKSGWLKHAGINNFKGLIHYIQNSNKVTVYKEENKVVNFDIYQLIAELYKPKTV